MTSSYKSENIIYDNPDMGMNVDLLVNALAVCGE